MKNSTDSVRRAASYRQEAREALKGRWGAALGTCLLLVLLPLVPLTLLALIPSLIPQELIQVFTTALSDIQNGALALNVNELTDVIIPTLTSILAVVAGAALLEALIQPFLVLGQAKMGVNLYTGEKAGFRVLGIGWRSYWKTVGLAILTYLATMWPMMLVSFLSGIGATLATNWAMNYALVGNDPGFVIQLIPVVFAIIMIFMMCVTVYRYFRYIPGIYLLAMHPDGPITKIMRRSRAIMKGNKWRFFCLAMSFIGWLLLNALFTLAVPVVLLLVLEIPTVLWAAPLAFVVVGILAALPLVAYQEVSYVAFICDIGNKKRRVHAD